jgi:RES domain-containing protein
LTRVHRILRKPYAKTPFDGTGAYRFGGRWSSPGTRLAYTSEHLSLALLEYFVHVAADDPPNDLVVATADIPGSVSRSLLTAQQLPKDWRASPAPPSLTRFGDEFVRAGRVAVLVVPSVLAPAESNWLLNPQHPDFFKIRLRRAKAFQYDSRLFK